jgi:hypothetical protein
MFTNAVKCTYFCFEGISGVLNEYLIPHSRVEQFCLRLAKFVAYNFPRLMTLWFNKLGTDLFITHKIYK